MSQTTTHLRICPLCEATADRPGALDPLSGNALLNAIPVSRTPVGLPAPAAAAAAAVPAG